MTLPQTHFENWAQPIVDQYIDDVLAGEQVACKWVKRACQRHRDDLEHGHERGLWFDSSAGQLVIDFFGLLQHYKGQWAGQNIEMEPWQMFICWVLFGWKRVDGTRRFKIAYNEVARKNGKSTFAAGIGLFLLVADGEPGAEIYSAATKMDQAKIIHDAAIRMVRQSASLRKRCGIQVNNIHVDATHSMFRPLGADAKTLDGLNPHAGMVDELHEHKDSAIWDVLRSAMGSRRQPLIFAITTAGFNSQCFCKQEQNYACNVLDGTVQDDAYFAIIYTLDEGDDWQDEDVWIKANPNLDISVSRQDMRQMMAEAIMSAEKRNNFLTKKCNVWTTQHVTYFNVESWKKCPTHDKTLDDFAGRPCVLGLDLASKRDITANVALFPCQDHRYEVLPFFYCPEESARQRSREDRVPYLTWADQGHLVLTPGSKIDTNFIVADIVRIFATCDVSMLGFDPWGFNALQDMLTNAGIDAGRLVELRPILQYLTAPTKELEVDIIEGNIIHNANPVMTWMIANTVVYVDPNDNVRPVKNKSSEKIDGVLALLTAKAIYAQNKPAGPSKYEAEGVIMV